MWDSKKEINEFFPGFAKIVNFVLEPESSRAGHSEIFEPGSSWAHEKNRLKLTKKV